MKKALTTMSNGIKHYVSTAESRKEDKKIILTYTTNPKEAHRFENKIEALRAIEGAINHFNRHLLIEDIEGEKAATESITAEATNLI